VGAKGAGIIPGLFCFWYNLKIMKKLQKTIFLIFLFSIPLFAFADTLGETREFYIDSTYDFSQREKISATLRKVSSRAYFYIEDAWFLALEEKERENVLKILEEISQEFDEVIYPKLTSFFGSEWNPGIDGDPKITILFHKMRKDAAGYFNSGDEYPKIQNPRSNQREMIYLNAENISSPILKSYIAHEFIHLITFNQKNRIYGVEEETWLNEARAEYAPTFLGYDKEYEGSYLWQRVKQFISNPSDSLTEWQNSKSDYGVVNLFIQYLVDHYGTIILADSLKSNQVGIPSLNYALRKNGFQKDVSSIFVDWLITLYLNDCSYGPNFCYKNENLKNLKITPSLIFLPSTQLTEINLNYSIKEWSGNWYRVFGGKGDLVLKFNGEDDANFNVTLIFCKDTEKCKIENMPLDQKKDGEILIENFDQKWSSLTIIPSIQSKTSGFGAREPLYQFSLFVSIKPKPEENAYIRQLLEKIAQLQKQIEEYQRKINEILSQRGQISCTKIEKDLYYGLINDPQVRCLQEFLKAQGPEIYPEGLVTGNFLNLTKQAVIRFQEKYKEEILKPLGLDHGTGFVGPLTRAKINQLLQH
jgi:hypothetical protein